MSSRLFRFMLALVIAFVFAGRMEAAAAHCRSQLAAASIGPARSMTDANMPNMDMPNMGVDDMGVDDMDMDDMDMPAMAVGDCPDHMAPKAGHPAKTSPCDCLALLIATPIEHAPELSVSMVAFRWQRPAEVTFASIAPAPDLRPPKA